ncbi:4'-phosphopantetheinyl transferase family protein [Geminocystis herdmanii]|uniref:4'-phosphopantetheinyl transferase family protein n=1 Tax=Geminocystis herdmanii TaxID=669359 RepID=UPI0003457C18|nr:4'-phosphopantetheinyl transferase superfamily protein [Geminocystis herdmanii]
MTEIPSNHHIIKENSVDIWLLNIEDFILTNDRDYLSILSEDEQEKYHNFKITLQRDRFLINRANLRLILAKYLNINPQEIVFNYSDKGKPSLNFNIHPDKIYFNLSHKNNYTVYGIGQYNLGIDLEKIDDKVKIENIAKRFFCPQEYEHLTLLKEEDKPAYFFTLWTIKEAYLKSIGLGLSGGLDSIYIEDIGDNHNYQILNNQGKKLEHWMSKTWNILDNYILSIAVNKLEYQSNQSLVFNFFTMDK